MPTNAPSEQEFLKSRPSAEARLVGTDAFGERSLIGQVTSRTSRLKGASEKGEGVLLGVGGVEPSERERGIDSPPNPSHANPPIPNPSGPRAVQDNLSEAAVELGAEET